MSITAFLTGIWFILWGASTEGWVDVSGKTLALLAFITGILWIVDQFRPLTIGR